MIRPLTFVTLLLAAASGLYLYQTKHRAEVLDQQVARTLRQTAAVRERIGILRAEWALLNEPDRLGRLAAQHLDLQKLVPTQFVAVAELGARMPLVAAPSAFAEAVEEEAPPAVSPPTPVRVVAAAAIPVPAPNPAPAPPIRPAPAAVAHAPEPPPRPAPPPPTERAPAERSSVERAWAAKRDPALRRASLSPATSAAPEPPPLARQPVFAPVLSTAATPVVTSIPTRLPAPVVTSALGGFGRPSLAPPIPIGGN